MNFALRTQPERRLGLFQIAVLATGQSLVFIVKHQRNHWPWIIARADDTLYGEAQNGKLQLIAVRYRAFYFSMPLRQDGVVAAGSGALVWGGSIHNILDQRHDTLNRTRRRAGCADSGPIKHKHKSMQISVSSAFNLMIFLIILVLTVRVMIHFRRTKPIIHAHKFARHKRPARVQNQRALESRKPGWVQTEVMRLLAMTRGQAGCRMVAAMFNARFAFRGESVSKTYVAELRKRCRYEITQLRKVMREPPRPGKPNQTWALDWTHVTIGVETHTLLGVIDHGSRRLLALCCADKSATTVLSVLNRLIAAFGKPKSLRTDNDGALVSTYFALAMLRLDIKHQRSAPHSPWMNGRIERFFGTFKQAIRQIEISSKS